jgi:serpin B
VAASNKFGFELYARVKAGQGNAIYSPVSASIALTMAWAGARGETQRQMRRVLALGSIDPGQAHPAYAALLEALNGRDGQAGVALRVADRLWGQKDLTFRPEYLRLLSERYRAPLEIVDFVGATEEARLAINRWGAIETRNRIPEVLRQGDVDQGTRLVLTNAVYLKAPWAAEFHKGHTADAPFMTPEGKVVAKMMSNEGSFRYARAGDLQILELDYRGGLSMVIVLPDAKDGLAAAEGRLADSYVAWLKALDYKYVDLKLPRWTIRSRLMLGDALGEMGMASAFSPAANFTGMSTSRPLFIQRVLQEAFISVDEAGTEAAAITAVVMGTVSDGHSSERPIPFHADHPFLYLIRDKITGAVLFIGRVVDPR